MSQIRDAPAAASDDTVAATDAAKELHHVAHMHRWASVGRAGSTLRSHRKEAARLLHGETYMTTGHSAWRQLNVLH